MKSEENGITRRDGCKIIAESELPVITGEVKKSSSSIAKMQSIQEIITKIRTLRSEMNISPAIQIEAVFNVLDASKKEIAENNSDYIKQLAKLKEIKFEKDAKRPKNSALAVASGFEIFLPLEGLIDIEKEKTRLSKEITLANQEVERTTQKLSNENFVKNAPETEIEKMKIRLNEANLKIEKISESLKFLS